MKLKTLKITPYLSCISSGLFFCCALFLFTSANIAEGQSVIGKSTRNSVTIAKLRKAKAVNKRRLAKVCKNGIRRAFTGALYKPSSDVSDMRGGKPVLLLTGSNKTRTGSLPVYASNGKKICSFAFKASDDPRVNKGADHYYAGWSGGCGKSGSQLASAAKSSSKNIQIYIGWKNGLCIGPISPTSRDGAI